MAVILIGIADFREDIAAGQGVARYTIEGLTGGQWRLLARGTAIGRKLDRFAPAAMDS
jgi:hypothetical protein